MKSHSFSADSSKWYAHFEKLPKLESFSEIHEWWKEVFQSYLTHLDFNKKSIDTLFYSLEFGNWKDLHKENTEFADFDNEQLLRSFKGDLAYCSDRMSLDRLFRNHWKFWYLFRNELYRIKYPELENV